MEVLCSLTKVTFIWEVTVDANLGLIFSIIKVRKCRGIFITYTATELLIFKKYFEASKLTLQFYGKNEIWFISVLQNRESAVE